MGYKKYKRIIVLLSILIFLVIPVFSYDDALLINVDIITGSGLPVTDAYVGDTFYYNISLVNIGDRVVNASFKVKVYSPSGDELWNGTFQNVIIPPGYMEYIFPRKEYPIETGSGAYKSRYEVMRFSAAGTYKVVIKAENPTNFIHTISEAGLIASNNTYTEYFEAMPKWQRDWINKSLDWQMTSASILKNVGDINSAILNSSKKIEIFTLAVLVFTAILVISELYQHEVIPRRQFLVMLIIFSVLFGILTLSTVF